MPIAAYEIAGSQPGLSPLPAEAMGAASQSALQFWREHYPALDAWLQAGVSVAAGLRRIGLTLWTAKRLDLAAQALGDAVTADPTDGAAWLDLGFCQRALGATRAALEAFQRATETAPANARGWLAFGLAAKEAGELPRAEDAFSRALALDHNLDDAAYSLGLICFDARRYADAAGHWRELVARGYKIGSIRVGLGQCLFFLGEFEAAAAALGAHLIDNPGDEAITRRYALVCLMDGALRDGPEAGRAAYVAAAGARAEPIEKIARSAFLLLAGYGHATPALALARAFIPRDGLDPILDHHVAALAGAAPDRASNQYVSAYFDHFADTFDDQMAILGYKGPERMVALLDGAGAATRRALDLGCGSGAAAPLLRSRCERLIGVDLSAKMIDKARERDLYDELIVADMVETLAQHQGALDLVFAADSLIYLGDLEPLLDAVARALAPGGLFAFTLETTDAAPYVLQMSGRYAHAPKAIIASTAGRFALRARERTFLRLEANKRLNGEMIVLERRP